MQPVGQGLGVKGYVSKNVRVGLTGEIPSGASGLGLLVMSYLFRLVCKIGVILQMFASQMTGLAIVITNIPHINCPLLEYFFSNVESKNGYWLN
jgi:hypothetical protein